MTDLEKTRLVAEAMGFAFREVSMNKPEHTIRIMPGGTSYWPLTDDAQCFALVKRFDLSCERWPEHGCGLPIPMRWRVGHTREDRFHVDYAMADNLNAAVVACVAKMELSKMQGSPR